MPETPLEERVRDLMEEAAARDNRSSGDGEVWLLSQLGAGALSSAAEGMPGHRALSAAAESTEATRGLGHRILKRLEREAHSMLCGQGEEDVRDRSALGIDGASITAGVSVVLTAGLGVGPQIAAVAAALIARRLVQPSIDEACAYWAEHLDE